MASRRMQRIGYGSRREARQRVMANREVIPCKHCAGTGQMLWRPPEQAGGVGEECTCEWCDGAGYVLQRASGEPCAICGGTGIAVVPIAYEDAQGVVHHEVKHQTCHGCNGTGEV